MRSATLLSLLPLAMAAPFTSNNMKRDRPAPVIIPRGGNHIDGKYIIRMKSDSATTAVESAISAIKADADYTYTLGFSGFAATLDDDELEKMQTDPNVRFYPTTYLTIQTLTCNRSTTLSRMLP